MTVADAPPAAVTFSVAWTGCAHTEQIGDLMAALASAQAEMRGAVKDANNPHLKNSYADLFSVWSAWQEAGPKHGLGVSQFVEAGADFVTVHSILGHASGQWMRDTLRLPWELQKGITPAQAIGSAMTYARRYALAALVGVCPEDDDGNASAPTQGRKPRVDPKQLEAARAKLVGFFPDRAACEKWLEGKKRPILDDLSVEDLEGACRALAKAREQKAAQKEAPAAPAVEANSAPKKAPDRKKLTTQVVLRSAELFGADDAGKELFHRWCDRRNLLAWSDEKGRPSISASSIEELETCLERMRGLTEEAVAIFAEEDGATRSDQTANQQAAEAAEVDPWD